MSDENNRGECGMSDEGIPAEFRLEYIDNPHCQTVPCTGAVLAGPPNEAALYQLMFYADMAHLQPHELKRMPTESGEPMKYEHGRQAVALPYREIQAKILISGRTLAGLAKIILDTVPNAKQELAEKGDVPAQ